VSSPTPRLTRHRRSTQVPHSVRQSPKPQFPSTCSQDSLTKPLFICRGAGTHRPRWMERRLREAAVPPQTILASNVQCRALRATLLPGAPKYAATSTPRFVLADFFGRDTGSHRHQCFSPVPEVRYCEPAEGRASDGLDARSAESSGRGRGENEALFRELVVVPTRAAGQWQRARTARSSTQPRATSGPVLGSFPHAV
jgi:hypothetical protein